MLFCKNQALLQKKLQFITGAKDPLCFFTRDIINDYCKLTIRLSDAIKSNQQENTQTKGITIDANFEQVIDEENTIGKAFNTNYNQLLEDYINEIF